MRNVHRIHFNKEGTYAPIYQSSVGPRRFRLTIHQLDETPFHIHNADYMYNVCLKKGKFQMLAPKCEPSYQRAVTRPPSSVMSGESPPLWVKQWLSQIFVIKNTYVYLLLEIKSSKLLSLLRFMWNDCEKDFNEECKYATVYQSSNGDLIILFHHGCCFIDFFSVL